MVTCIPLNTTRTNKKDMSYTRGKKKSRVDVMEQLIASNQLTRDGADWLRLRMDPYHDLQRPVAGYPDSNCLDTLVSVLNYESNVTKPAASAGTWDAHIFTAPLDSCNFNLGNYTVADGKFKQTGAAYSMGLVTVAKDDSGAPLFPTAVPVASANFAMAAVAGFDGVEAGMSRVIGMGVEVIDTTSAMYKQGALTAYRMPSVRESFSTIGYENTAGTLVDKCESSVMMSPPSTVAEAVLYRSAVQWDAPRGAYMVMGQEGIDLPFEIERRNSMICTPNPVGDANAVVLHTARLAVVAVSAPPIPTPTVSNAMFKHVNVTQSGIFLTGLANSASFKIRVRVYVERAPMRTETDLIALATPSAPYDAKALELYSILVSNLPVAVPVDFNAKGDWWRWILGAISQLAPVVGSFFGPGGTAIGSAVSGLSSAIKIAATKKKPEREEKKIPMITVK